MRLTLLKSARAGALRTLVSGVAIQRPNVPTM